MEKPLGAVECEEHGMDCPDKPTNYEGVRSVVLHTHSICEPYLYFCEDSCPHCGMLIGPQPHKEG